MTESRYELLVKIATGGMATVYVGCMRGALGFEQLVALKRPHEHLRGNEAFRRALVAEARLSARIRHANVVAVRDTEMAEDTVLLVMDYIEGGSLADLELVDDSVRASGDRTDIAPVALRILLDVCAGLHAAHELRGDDDRPLGLVHRDVSPQNVLVGLDGVARVTDFGIAKCIEGNTDATTDGTVKGKLAYMSPEQLSGKAVDRRADVFAIGIVLWESLTGRRLFKLSSPGETIARILAGDIASVSSVTPSVGPWFDDVIAKALDPNPDARWPTTAALADAIESAATTACAPASHTRVARFVDAKLGEQLAQRRDRVRALRSQRGSDPDDDRDATASLTFTMPSGDAPSAPFSDDFDTLHSPAPALDTLNEPPRLVPPTQESPQMVALPITMTGTMTIPTGVPPTEQSPGDPSLQTLPLGAQAPRPPTQFASAVPDTALMPTAVMPLGGTLPLPLPPAAQRAPEVRASRRAPVASRAPRRSRAAFWIFGFVGFGLASGAVALRGRGWRGPADSAESGSAVHAAPSSLASTPSPQPPVATVTSSSPPSPHEGEAAATASTTPPLASTPAHAASTRSPAPRPARGRTPAITTTAAPPVAPPPSITAGPAPNPYRDAGR